MLHYKEIWIMGALWTMWQELDKQYRDINPIGQIVFGIVFVIVGGGFSLLLMQGRSPLICLGAGWVVAGFYIPRDHDDSHRKTTIIIDTNSV
jgi:hypothetical protein